MYFASNIKLLRKRRKRTQDDIATILKMKRSTLSGYENLVAQPGLEALVALSGYYNVSIDTLIRVDLSKLSESQLSQLERGFDVFIKGEGLRVLVSTVDSQNRENIELVPEKAKAGYATGYSDPQYIEELPRFQLPFLSKEKKYRTFQVSGDSMLPILHGSWVTGEYMQDWTTIKSGEPCVVLTYDEGIVFKVVENHVVDKQMLILHSLNPVYRSYSVEASSVKEIWRFVHYISSEMPPSTATNELLVKTVADLKNDLELMKKKIGF